MTTTTAPQRPTVDRAQLWDLWLASERLPDGSTPVMSLEDMEFLSITADMTQHEITLVSACTYCGCCGTSNCTSRSTCYGTTRSGSPCYC